LADYFEPTFVLA